MAYCNKMQLKTADFAPGAATWRNTYRLWFWPLSNIWKIRNRMWPI